MANRTPPDQWAALFNFAGGGLIHMETYAAPATTTFNPYLIGASFQNLLAAADPQPWDWFLFQETEPRATP